MTLRKPTHQVVATVLGSGTMGAGIAAHLAGAGAKTYLLDIVPRDTPKDAGPSARSALALKAISGLTKAKPPALMGPDVLTRLVPGNLEDDLERAIGESDLVIEAVVERLDVKVSLFEKVAKAARPDAILATNTSGIPIGEIAAGIPQELRSRFLGLHFFNPPRWMHLLEVIPGAETSPTAVREAADFCDRALGKGIVECKDTPNFIGNRIGIVEMLLTFQAAVRGGFTVEEVDFLNGPLMGRPKTGSFRLGDMVGLDIIGHVVGNLKTGLSGEPGSPRFDPLYSLMEVPEVVTRLAADGRLGDKTGAGFYKKAVDERGKKQILSLDLNSLEYRPAQAPDFEELSRLIKLLDLGPRVGEALRREGRGGDFLRQVLVPLFNYSAALMAEIADTPQQIDEAMRFGYGWQMGPFELCDAAGPAWVIEELKRQGATVAPLLQALVDDGGADARFYNGPSDSPQQYIGSRGRVPVKAPQGAIILDHLRDAHTIHKNPSACLIDIGDGVACLEFRSKANILDDGVVRMITEAPELLHQKGFKGMVLGNQADHFCRGANLMHIAGLIAQKKFDEIDVAIAALQDSFMGLRHGPIPVIAAPLGQTLGGGTEACLHCHEIQAGADLFMGLVEIAVGVLPAGGGLKEIARRASVWASQMPGTDPYPFARRGFEAVAAAKVSTSAAEAKANGFLAATDGVTFHRRRVIEDAKKRALGLAARGFEPPSRLEPITALGRTGASNLAMGVKLFGWGGYASEHDELIGRKVVHVLSGGSAPEGSTITAQTLLDLEREAFLALCGEAKTFERISHMLSTKRPLRN